MPYAVMMDELRELLATLEDGRERSFWPEDQFIGHVSDAVAFGTITATWERAGVDDWGHQYRGHYRQVSITDKGRYILQALRDKQRMDIMEANQQAVAYNFIVNGSEAHGLRDIADEFIKAQKESDVAAK